MHQKSYHHTYRHLQFRAPHVSHARVFGAYDQFQLIPQPMRLQTHRYENFSMDADKDTGNDEETTADDEKNDSADNEISTD